MKAELARRDVCGVSGRAVHRAQRAEGVKDGGEEREVPGRARGLGCEEFEATRGDEA